MNKRILLILCAQLLLFSCMEEESVENENISILLSIPNNLILDDQYVDVLIHNKDGVFIERKNNMENKNNYEFLIYNETGPILFSLIFKSQSNYYDYRVETFLIEESINITLGNYTNKNISKSRFRLFDGSDNKWNLVTSSSGYWGDGSGTIWNLQPRFFPPNELTSFTDANTGLRKVVNIINPQENETVNLDSLEIKDIVDSTTYQVNETGFTYSILYGRRSNIDQHYIRLSEDRDDSNPIKKHYLPIDSINDFMLWTEVDRPEDFFGAYELKSNFNLDFSKPEIDLEINDLGNNRLKIKSSNGDFFKTTFHNINSGFRIRWEIHGEIDQVAEVKIPNIDNYMMEKESNYVPEKFETWDTEIYKTQEQWRYDQFISFSIENALYYNIPSTIEYYTQRH